MINLFEVSASSRLVQEKVRLYDKIWLSIYLYTVSIHTLLACPASAIHLNR